MAAHGARRLQRMVENLDRILGVELLCAAQGVEFRAPLETSAPLKSVIKRLRQDVGSLTDDRYLAPELEVSHILINTAEIIVAADVTMPEVSA